jgi:glutathione S-transferase
MTKFRFYGMPHSLYSGKARSYLIKQHVDFEEMTPGHPRYGEKVMPAIQRWIIPVLETPDGEIVQDGTDIIDWFEKHGLARHSAYPESPRQRITSLIFEMFGGEGMVRPAMHYRWNFDETNLDFIEDQFGLFAMPSAPREKRLEIIRKSTGRMRAAAVMFGVVPETIPVIEEAYEELLDELNAHFAETPYLLGGTPTIGDYGLIASLFAHLGRDPYPAQMMKRRAPALFRWTERMNAWGADMSEFLDYPEALLPGDEIPATLKTLLKRVASDYLPEIRAFTAFTNDWLAENPDLPADTPVGGEKLVRAIGKCTFEWRGKTFDVGVMPYRFYLLQRIQDAFDALGEEDRKSVGALLEETGLSEIMTLRSTRRVGRKNNIEVWEG